MRINLFNFGMIMDYNIFPPPLHLKDLVQCFWTLESDPQITTPKEYFLMADSFPEIIFQYNEGFRAYSAQSARIRFQHSITEKFNVGKKVGFFGVRFYPHAVNQLLKNKPANEVVDHVFDFTDLFKQEGTDLADQIYNAGSTLERITYVSAFLTKNTFCQKIDPFKYFVDHVIQQKGSVDISAMHYESGLSVKQFERRFKSITGFPPKYFARLTRFQAIKDSYALGRFASMTSLAYSGDYYDQSHFNREFKEFSGVHPRQYFKQAEQSRFDGYLPCGWFV
jgi:AraC-like DNA-binding protein